MSVTKFDNLESALAHLKNKHKQLLKGVYCLKLMRRSDGTRVPFEELRGIRIKDFQVYDTNTVIIVQHSHGTRFNSKQISTFDAVTYLPDLAMINVYDYSAEFLTNVGIDFVYLEQTKEAKTVMLAEWIHDTPRLLRAQWFKDDETEQLLKGIGLGQKIQQFVPLGRNLEID